MKKLIATCCILCVFAGCAVLEKEKFTQGLPKPQTKKNDLAFYWEKASYKGDEINGPTLSTKNYSGNMDYSRWKSHDNDNEVSLKIIRLKSTGYFNIITPLKIEAPLKNMTFLSIKKKRFEPSGFLYGVSNFLSYITLGIFPSKKTIRIDYIVQIGKGKNIKLLHYDYSYAQWFSLFGLFGRLWGHPKPSIGEDEIDLDLNRKVLNEMRQERLI